MNSGTAINQVGRKRRTRAVKPLSYAFREQREKRCSGAAVQGAREQGAGAGGCPLPTKPSLIPPPGWGLRVQEQVVALCLPNPP